MADVTYNDHPEDNSPTANDYIPYWDVADSQAKRALRSALVGATLTGGGAIDTGGNTLVIADSGTLDLGGNTLTVPASGTAALIETGTWEPELLGSVSNPSSITYGGRTGEYTRIGDVVFFALQMTITSFTGGDGSARVTLPFAARNNPGIAAYRNDVLIHNTTLSDASRGITLGVVRGTNFAAISITRSNSTDQPITLGDLGSNVLIQATGVYHAD